MASLQQHINMIENYGEYFKLYPLDSSVKNTWELFSSRPLREKTGESFYYKKEYIIYNYTIGLAH